MLRLRWQDDVLNVMDRSISRDARLTVRESQARNFYGGELMLEEEKDEDTAFGFRWETTRGVVRVRGASKYEEEDQRDGERAKGVPVVQGLCDFSSRTRKTSTGYARVLRLLDMTNRTTTDVVRQVGRCLCELKIRGYPTSVLEEIRRKADRESWASLKSLKAVTHLNQTEAKDLARVEDWAREREREIEQFARKRERSARVGMKQLRQWATTRTRPGPA